MKDVDFWLNVGILVLLVLGFNLVRQNGGLLPDFSSTQTEGIHSHEVHP